MTVFALVDVLVRVSLTPATTAADGSLTRPAMLPTGDAMRQVVFKNSAKAATCSPSERRIRVRPDMPTSCGNCNSQKGKRPGPGSDEYCYFSPGRTRAQGLGRCGVFSGVRLARGPT